MLNADEIDKRVEGTELAAMIDKGAANQRSGVLGSLNMVADAFKLLPKESETKQRWSTVEWAKERKGWVFLTSKPTMRERMRPLISLWLDLLVLRLMNDDTVRRKTWFVLDELASLQRLPQLSTVYGAREMHLLRVQWRFLRIRLWDQSGHPCLLSVLMSVTSYAVSTQNLVALMVALRNGSLCGLMRSYAK